MKVNVFTLWKNLAWPDVKITQPLPIGEGVLDASGFRALEVDQLFESLNHTSTNIGQAVLFQSLTQPLDKLHNIEDKQRAVEELQTNATLRAMVENIVSSAAIHETHFYQLLFADFLPMFDTAKNEQQIEGYGYLQYRRGVHFIQTLISQVQACPEPESDYLRSLFDQIKGFSGSRVYALMTQAVYLTETALLSKQEKRKAWWQPAIVFHARLFKPLLIGLMAAALGALIFFMPFIVNEAIFFTPFLLLYLPLVGGFDRDHFILPLRDLFKQSPELAVTMDALGQLDELLSFVNFSERFPHETVMPSMIESEQHRMVLCQAINPVLGNMNEHYIGNDLQLDHQKLLLITGPNSGGKTAFCKTIAQIQLLAQIGCVVPARSATLSVADKIFYQTPEISRLQDGEGRFGAELKRTKDIFLATSARSLVILDELSEGTTFEEKMESSMTVLKGFYRKGSSTILITHNHQLVDGLLAEHLGVAKQVEFLNEAPTHKIIDGISRVSHADRVAKKIGFSQQDIDDYFSAASSASQNHS